MSKKKSALETAAGRCKSAAKHSFDPAKIEKRALRIWKHHRNKGVSIEQAREAAPDALHLTKLQLKEIPKAERSEYVERQIKDRADRDALSRSGIDVNRRQRERTTAMTGGRARANWRDWGYS
jgi:hypothetical protein